MRLLALLLTFCLTLVMSAEVRITIDHNRGAAATRAFKFAHVPSPSKSDAAENANGAVSWHLRRSDVPATFEVSPSVVDALLERESPKPTAAR